MHSVASRVRDLGSKLQVPPLIRISRMGESLRGCSPPKLSRSAPLPSPGSCLTFCAAIPSSLMHFTSRVRRSDRFWLRRCLRDGFSALRQVSTLDLPSRPGNTVCCVRRHGRAVLFNQGRKQRCLLRLQRQFGRGVVETITHRFRPRWLASRRD